MPNIFRRNAAWTFGLILGLSTLLVHRMSNASSIEAVYGNGLFRAVRLFLDYTFGLLPFAGALVLLVALLLGIYRLLAKGRWHDWRQLMVIIVGFCGYVIFFFYFLWGFNYSRPGVVDRVGWQLEKLTAEQLEDFALEHVDRLNKTRTLAFGPGEMSTQGGQQIRRDAYDLARALGYEVSGKDLRLRQWSDIGFLLRIGTAGFYNPFTGECNIDGGLHQLQKPYVIAHEYFHGMGVTDEGECNFLAYLICHRSQDPYVRYAGELALWRYLRSALARTDESLFERVSGLVLPEINQDLRAIRTQMEKYPDLMPQTRDRIYNAYLRSNKVAAGMASYGQVIGLVINWSLNERLP
ncbi:MAG: DUF3810 domain-containing protein [Saprospiraceae bacterium]|nr:DUF3810 domain-containing protein [Saprospiraceae bacterium]